MVKGTAKSAAKNAQEGGFSTEALQRLIGVRVRAAREEREMNQEALSSALGFKDRQILSNIESGKRRVSADELVRLMQVLGKSLEFFTDSFLLAGEASFSFRAKAEEEALAEFEVQAGKWIALYRRLGELLGEKPSPLTAQLPVSKKDSYESVQECAEQLGTAWKLGESPAFTLPRRIEEELDTVVLFVDAPPDISGTACRLPTLNAIIINRNEPEGRRSYDLGHELFHLLTWEKMPPSEIESSEPGKKTDRVEQLADNFASALLMPQKVMKKLYEKQRDKEDINTWLNTTAETLGVSSLALLWRLRNMGSLREEDDASVDESLLSWRGKAVNQSKRPRLFSEKFVKRIEKGIADGYVSVGKTTELLGIPREELVSVFNSYDIEAPFNL